MVIFFPGDSESLKKGLDIIIFSVTIITLEKKEHFEMAGYNLSRRHNINEKVEEFKKLKNCHLVDIREKDEFKAGRIPGAVNVPLSTPEVIEELIPNKNHLVYVYCQSGARSRGAAKKFVKMGYQRVQQIGGIRAYTGEIEKD